MLFSFQQPCKFRKKRSSSVPDLQTELKTAAINLSRLNSRVSSLKRWMSQVLTLAGFLVTVHPARLSFFPFMNSVVSILANKATDFWVNYKTAEFKEIVIACTLKKNGTEAMLEEMAQIMMGLDLPVCAKEILQEAVLVIGAESALQLKQSDHHPKVKHWHAPAVA